MPRYETALSRLDAVLVGAEDIDWNDPRAVHADVGKRFDHIMSEPGLLREAVAAVVTGIASQDGSESYEGMDKLVLWRSADRELRLRLHLFPVGFAGRPHHHRWSFMSRMLAGTYIHSLYGPGSEVLEQIESGRVPAVRYEHKVVAGSEYVIDHSVVHSIRADQVAASLCLRGPSLLDRYFTVMDPTVGQVRWNQGAAQESDALRRQKTMKPEDFERVFRMLEELEVM